mgnify:CR=1 FL=1
MDKIDKIIRAYKEAGYKINTHKNTTVEEPFKSLVDGKVFYKEKCYSSKEKDFKFLENCLKDFNLKID